MLFINYTFFLRPELRDPRRFGPTLHGDLLKMNPYAPCFMHGERVLFLEKRSKKHKVPSTYVQYPQIMMTSFYSRLLDMKILCRVSNSAFWMIEQEYGGFDEYVLTAPEDCFEDFVAKMYRTAIKEAHEKQKEAMREEVLEALKGHGEEYIK